MDWGANALSAPLTPGKRLPVVDKTKVDPATLNAAEGFEAMFLDYLMQVMRQTVPKNDMDMKSPATEIYTQMLDSEHAHKAAKAGGVGLADQIIAYLEAGRYTLDRMHSAPSRDQGSDSANRAPTGGFDEGQSDKQ